MRVQCVENEILILIVVEKFKMDVRQGSRGKLREDAVGKSTECEIIHGYWDSGNRPIDPPTDQPTKRNGNNGGKFAKCALFNFTLCLCLSLHTRIAELKYFSSAAFANGRPYTSGETPFFYS